MTDDQQRARELLAQEYERDGITHVPDCIRREAMLTEMEHRAVRAITAALRAAPDAVALRVAMETLEQIANAPDDQGARLKAAGTFAFLKTQGAGGPEGFGSLSPVEHVRYWAEAYGPQATEPHFQGHGMVAALLAEYADLLERLAARPQGVKDAT